MRLALLTSLLFGVTSVAAARPAEAVPVSVVLEGYVSFVSVYRELADVFHYGDPVRIGLTYEAPAPDTGSPLDSDQDSHFYEEAVQYASFQGGNAPELLLANTGNRYAVVLNDAPGDTGVVDGDHVRIRARMRTSLAASASLFIHYLDPLGYRISDDTLPRDLDNPFPYQVANLSFLRLGSIDVKILSTTVLAIPEPSIGVLSLVLGMAVIARRSGWGIRPTHG